MKLVKAYNSVSLVLRIVIGMVIGAALALLIPNAAVTAPGIGILGTLFVGALKAIAPLLVFVLIISALAQSKEKLGKQFGTVIVLAALFGLLFLAYMTNADMKLIEKIYNALIAYHDDKDVEEQI